MTNVIDRTEEKIELAKQLCLKGYVRAKEEEKAVKKAIRDLTGMSFKPISEGEIEKKITSRVWDFNSFRTSEARSAALSASTASFVCIFVIALFYGYLGQAWKALAVYPVFLLVLLASCYRKTKVQDMYICEWQEELPYGALLAMKEAKEKGVAGVRGLGPEMYKIYYPVYASSIDRRVKEDPVIVGYFNGVLVEIFAWDDSKIYE